MRCQGPVVAVFHMDGDKRIRVKSTASVSVDPRADGRQIVTVSVSDGRAIGKAKYAFGGYLGECDFASPLPKRTSIGE